MLIGSIT